ncbi:MAG: Fic family protein [Oscillospiraceae bacterium]
MHSDFSRYDVYTEIGSQYCYKDSHTLKNKYGVRDFQTLRQVEQDVVGAKQQYLLKHPIQGKFTTTHFCNIHRFLFEDVYPFAGRFRLETIKKGDTTFENEKAISLKLHILLDKLKMENYLTKLPHNEFVARLTYYLAELNYIHPFREGNGRATREFIRLLVIKNGYEINWTAAGVTALMDAMITSVYDTVQLQKVLELCLKKND